MADRKITAPPVNPETERFWEAAAQGKLLIKKCAACGEVLAAPQTPKWAPFNLLTLLTLLGIGAVLIAWLTVGFHAYLVARAKPVSALRYE